MRRFTFSVMMALATVAANAQNFGTKAWADTLSTVEKTENLVRSTPVAVDNDGNAIVTGSYDKDLAFGNDVESLTDNDKFIAKYDKNGKRLWAAGIQGKATITAVTTDEDGNIYVAGNFAEQVNVLSKNGEGQVVQGMEDGTSGACFIVKYNKDGERQLVKTIVPTADASVITDDILYALQEPAFNVNKIMEANGKLYLSATYKNICKIGDLTLTANFVNSEGWMLADAPSASVLSLDAATLDNAKELATLSAKEKIAVETLYGPEDINFAVNGNAVYAGFVAKGAAVILKAAGKEEDLSFEYSNDLQERAFIITKIEGENNATTKVFNAPASVSTSWNFMDQMVCKNGNLYVAGTFNEPNPFDNTVLHKTNCDIYVASLNADDLSKNWVAASGFDEGETNKTAEMVSGLAVNGDNIIVTGWAETTADHVIATPLTFVVDKDRKMTRGEETLVTAMATNGTTVLTESDKDGAYTYTYYTDMPKTGIKQLVKAEGISRNGDVISFEKTSDISVYNVSGALVKTEKNASSVSLAELAAGVYVVKAGNVSVKVAK